MIIATYLLFGAMFTLVVALLVEEGRVAFSVITLVLMSLALYNLMAIQSVLGG